MSDSEDQPVEIELYEEVADELVRYSTPEGSRSPSPHQSPRQSRSKDPRINMMSAPTPQPALRSSELVDPLEPRRVEATLCGFYSYVNPTVQRSVVVAI